MQNICSSTNLRKQRKKHQNSRKNSNSALNLKNITYTLEKDYQNKFNIVNIAFSHTKNWN